MGRRRHFDNDYNGARRELDELPGFVFRVIDRRVTNYQLFDLDYVLANHRPPMVTEMEKQIALHGDDGVNLFGNDSVEGKCGDCKLSVTCDTPPEHPFGIVLVKPDGVTPTENLNEAKLWPEIEEACRLLVRWRAEAAVAKRVVDAVIRRLSGPAQFMRVWPELVKLVKPNHPTNWNTYTGNWKDRTDPTWARAFRQVEAWVSEGLLLPGEPPDMKVSTSVSLTNNIPTLPDPLKETPILR